MTKFEKIKLIFIIMLSVIGALLIYNKFEYQKSEEKTTDKFLQEYSLLNKDYVYKRKNSSEIINILNNETGIIFFCNPNSSWCQTYAKLLDETAKENNINTVYYNDIKEDRTINSNNYRRIVKYLYNYLDNDDTNNKRLNMPCTVFIKNGKIIALDKTTSFISSDIEADEYWTNNRINEFKIQISNYIYQMNNNDIENDVEESEEEL